MGTRGLWLTAFMAHGSLGGAVLAAESLSSLLTAWLPGQRWFAGGASVTDVDVLSEVVLAAGDPEFRHFLVRVASAGSVVDYQVPVGLRAALPPALRPALIGQVADGRFAYDALADPELTAILLHGIVAGKRSGPLRFTAEPSAAVDGLPGLPGVPLTADQSNSSVVFGDAAILKVLRRPLAGQHPDLEIPGVLSMLGSPIVAAPLGWIECADENGMTVLAILSTYFPGAASAWDLALANIAEGHDGFTAQASALGETTGRMHADLARGFGTDELSAEALAGMSAVLNADLDAAMSDVPELRPHEPALRSCYRALERMDGAVRVQRIHGDYHLGQVLAANDAWIVIDFEGEPAVQLARRTAMAPSLRDVAGMLRSFDYASRHPFMEGTCGDEAAPQWARAWARACQAAFCDGYASVSGADPRELSQLLNVFLMQKAVYEAVYESKYRPGWLSIPMSAIAEACR